MRRAHKSWIAFAGMLFVVIAMASVAGVAGRSASSKDDRAGAARDKGELELDAVGASDPMFKDAQRASGARITNGTKVVSTPGTARWSSIGWLYANGAGCGGTVIAARYFLTAAHCVRRSGVTIASGTAFVALRTNTIAPIITSVRAGLAPATIAALTPVSRIVVHPSFNETSLANDVAVLELARDAGVPPMKLTGPGEKLAWSDGRGRAADAAGGPWVGGWGLTSSFGQISPDLLEANIPIMSDATCRADDIGYDTAQSLCAGLTWDDAPTATGACRGDSGGPLIVAASDGTMRLAGTVSYGFSGCTSFSYGYFARLDSQRAWIEQIAGPVSGTTTMTVAPPAPVGNGVTGGGPTVVAPPVAPPASNAETALTLTKQADGALATPVRPGAVTALEWSTAADATASQFSLRRDGAVLHEQALNGALGFNLNSSALPSGSTQWCVKATSKATGGEISSKCRTLVQNQFAIAEVNSMRVMSGKLRVSGRILTNTATVKVRSTARVGGRTVQLGVVNFDQIQLRGRIMKPVTFTMTGRWRGPVPRGSVVVTTTISVPGFIRSFKSTLR